MRYLIFLLLLCSPAFGQTQFNASGDATRKLQKLVDELLLSGKSETIELRDDIIVSDQITIGPPGVSFYSHGSSITQTGEKKATLRFDGTESSVVDGVRFVGCGKEKPWDTASYNGVAGVMLVGTTDATIRNCTFENHAGGSIVTRGKCPGTQILFNRIRGMGSGVIEGGVNGADAAISHGNAIAENDRFQIIGNQISGHAFGILESTGNSTVIANNTITDIPGQHGMYIAQGADMAVTGNVINGCHFCGIKVQHQLEQDVDSAVTITGNTVRRTGNVGIGIMRASGIDGRHYQRNVLISGNNVVDGHYGIYVRGAADAMVTGNRVRRCSLFGLFVRDSDGFFDANFTIDCKIDRQIELRKKPTVSRRDDLVPAVAG